MFSMGRLIIDGNNVYEIDENCIKNHRVSSQCGVLEKLKESENKSYQRQPELPTDNTYGKSVTGSHSAY